MALVDKGYFGFCTIMDGGGQKSTLQYDLRGADEIAASANMTAIRAALVALTDGTLVAYGVGYRYEEDAIAFPAATVQNENKLSCTVVLAGGDDRANYKVPAPNIGAFVSPTGKGSNECNLVAAMVTNYYDLFTLAGDAFIARGQDAQALESGKRVHAKSNYG